MMDHSKNQSANPSRDSSSREILSPGGKSRYGRTRRPKISQDFYHIDNVIIDENPVSHQPAPAIKSPKLKSPAKGAVIGREIIFELKDEFTKLDDLGMKVANNFKTNLQRGLDDSIKERKFFKSMNENKVEVPNVVDVTKVLKLISTKPTVISDVYEKKSPTKAALKTYSNKRKHLHEGDNCVVESFGLPDEPIIPVNSPFSFNNERDHQIDVDVNIEHDVNLPNPWSFDEFQSVPICLGDSITTMEEFNGSCFNRNNVLDLFSYDSLLSENSEIEDSVCFEDRLQNIPQSKEDAQLDTAKPINKKNEAINTATEKPKGKKQKNALKVVDNTKAVATVNSEPKKRLRESRNTVKNTEPVKNKESVTVEDKKINKVAIKKFAEDVKCNTVDITSPEVKTSKKKSVKVDSAQPAVDNKKETVDEFKKKTPNKAKVKPKQLQQQTESRRILRSNIVDNVNAKDTPPEKEPLTKDDTVSLMDTSETVQEELKNNSTIATSEDVSEKEDDSSANNHRTLRSKSSLEQPLPELQSIVKLNNQVINPVNWSKIICKSQVRVILNPLACIKKLPPKYGDDKNLVPNPFKLKKAKLKVSLKQKRKLRSSSKIISNSVSDSVAAKVKNNILKKKPKKQHAEVVEIKEEPVDVKKIKTEIVEYNVGDLTWAKIGTYPYWPCMITDEPFSGEHKKMIPNRSQPLYHVRFFGDNGRRSWVSSHRIMLYCSKDDLDNIAKVLKAEDKVKLSYIKESYIVKPAKLAKWQSGVDEAECLKSKSVEERLNYFFEIFASKREKKQKMLEEHSVKQEALDELEELDKQLGKGSRKRGRQSEDDNEERTKAKKTKNVNLKITNEDDLQVKEEIKNETKPPEEPQKKGKEDAPPQDKKGKKTAEEKPPESPKKVAKKPEIAEKNQTMPPPNSQQPSSPKKPAKKLAEEEQELRKKTSKKLDETAENQESRKRILRNSQQNEEGEAKRRLRNSSQADEDAKKPKPPPPPEPVVEKQKRNSVEAEPEEQDEYSPPKLRNKRHAIPCEYSNSDTDSKVSDNSSVPSSLEAQAALYRRNNIFRGIPKEKVCQICEKPGDVFKCKGPCNGVYHYNCAMSTQGKGDVEEKKIDSGKRDADADNKSNVEIISVNSKKPLPNLSASPNIKGMTLAEKIDFRMKEIMKKFDYQSVYSESTDSSSEEFILDESFEKNDSRTNKLKSQSKLSLTVTSKPSNKEVPIIKHVTADNINYICVTNEKPKDKVVTELIKDTLKHLRCTWCSSGEIAPCLVCNKEESKLGSKFRQKCSLHQCGKYYHPECLKVWPQTQWSLIQSTKDKKSDATYDTFVCPRHVCHTCISDDPRAANSRCPSDKVVKCLRCPATYHSSNYCVPAGTQILSSSQIVCPRHYSRSSKKRNFQQTINTNWCFICSKGGDLICCETCPTSVHVECLPGGQNADDTFFCEDCQSGRLPLYDEIVWVKLGTFRWWPALILFPNEVPDNVRNIAHNKGEFVVKFFGTYDHYWVGRGRTFLFQEGDKGHSHSARKRVDNAFVKAIEEAAVAHQLKKQFKGSKMAEKNNTALKPPPYIRIKVNKPVGNVRQFDGNTSNTTSCDCDPNQPHPCGPDSDCLNRLLLTECNPEVCPAGERCNNQCFEKREYPPLVPHHTQVRGWGLKTLAPIRKGQFVIEYVGEMIDEQEYQRRVQKMHEQKEENYYFLTIDKDRMLDAGPKGNVARFMNHSCQPNCETQKWTVNGDTRVGLFAKCDIPAGTELTFNYNLECIGKEKKICKCGAPNCSGFIGVKVKPEGAQKKSSSKPKKKKSPPPPPPEPAVTDNPCFCCGKTGNVGACNNKMCTKVYHLECVAMNAWPEGGKWVCQWHNCNFCAKRTIRCCVKCINSYCPPHSEGNIRYDKALGFVCTDHDPTKETNEAAGSGENAGSDKGTVEEVKKADEGSKKGEEGDDFLDSLNLEDRLNGSMTSTPLKKNNNNSDENRSQSNEEESAAETKRTAKDKKKKNGKKVEVNKVQIRNTANLQYNPIQNEVKLSNFTPPVKYLRTRKSSSIKSLNRTDPDKDLPIRKRTRLRCGNTL